MASGLDKKPGREFFPQMSAGRVEASDSRSLSLRLENQNFSAKEAEMAGLL
jgi:hypothetical protein